jgi:hypothetical protein
VWRGVEGLNLQDTNSSLATYLPLFNWKNVNLKNARERRQVTPLMKKICPDEAKMQVNDFQMATPY